jgi:rhodanese-related sulfurtransferase
MSFGPPRPNVPEVTVDELEQARAEGAPLIDVREPDEYLAGHVPGARPIPLGEVADRGGEVPRGEKVYVICAVGGRSARATQWYRSQGIDAVNVAGGTGAWAQSGKPVVEGPDPE